MSEALQEWLAYHHLEEKYLETKLKEGWQQIFGTAISKYTRKVSIRNGTLYLQIDSAPLKNELHLQAELLISQVNQFLQKDVVKKVVVQ